jgi:predicted membrane protein
MKKERVFWGVLFIVAGIFLVISKLGYFEGVNAISLILTVFLVSIIVKSVPRLNFSGILFPIAFIGIIYDKQLGITAITPWTILLAALFGSIGLSMIFNKHVNFLKRKHFCEEYKFEKIDVEDESHVSFRNSFGESIKYINTDKFEQADLNCSFGGMKVYFDNAVMSNENALVRIDASFAGIELFVPRTWKIEDRTHVFLGGISEKNKSDQIKTNTLILVGDISFAGVEIIYI